MSTPVPRSLHSSLLGLVALLLIAPEAFAGTMVATRAWRVLMAGSATTVRVLARSQARYEGPQDSLDKVYTINAGVKIGVANTIFNQQSKSGSIEPGLLVTCDGSCGSDVAVPMCDSEGHGVRYKVQGTTGVSHMSHPEFDDIWSEECETFCPNTPPGPEEDPSTPPGGGGQATGSEGSPIIVDLDGDDFHLVGLDDAVRFDINADGILEEIGWTSAGALDGFLALDVNRNGAIDNGSELFGNHSYLLDGRKASQGYMALGLYDSLQSGGNEDGVIDARDFVFSMLRIWIDLDHDGVSQRSELFLMRELGVVAVELSFVEGRGDRRDVHGNEFRFNSKAWIDLRPRRRGAEGRRAYDCSRPRSQSCVPRRAAAVRTSDAFFVVGE